MVVWDPKTLKIVQATMSKPRWLTIAGALMKVLGPEIVKSLGKKYIWWGDYHWRLFYSKTGNLYMGHVHYVVNFFKGKKGRLLDVGCGEGLIMKRIAEKSKLQCYGIDSSPLAIEFAHQHKIMNCKAISFEQFESDVLYNFIFMGDFLEHTKDPSAALEKAKDLLTDNGQIFITFPVQEKKGMEDLHIFPPETIGEFVEKTFAIETFFFHEDLQKIYVTGRRPKFIENPLERKEAEKEKSNRQDDRRVDQGRHDPTSMGNGSECPDKGSRA